MTIARTPRLEPATPWRFLCFYVFCFCSPVPAAYSWPNHSARPVIGVHLSVDVTRDSPIWSARAIPNPRRASSSIPRIYFSARSACLKIILNTHLMLWYASFFPSRMDLMGSHAIGTRPINPDSLLRGAPHDSRSF